jgi:hypothetical protein
MTTQRFYDDTTVLGVSPISGVPASLTTFLLPAGVTSLKAYYGGDANCAAGLSHPLPQTINAAPAVTFGAAVSSAVGDPGTDPVSVAIADFFQSGTPDLVTANFSGGQQQWQR